MLRPAEVKQGSESARLETAFGRCLVEGDPEATSRARRARRNTFGLSLVVEFLLLTMLLAVPLFTSVAKPALSRTPDLTFFRGAPHANHSPEPATAPTRPPTNYRHNPEGYVTAFTPRPLLRQPETIGESAAPTVDVIPGGSGAGAAVPIDLRPPMGAAPPELARKSSENRPLKLSEPVVAAQLVSRIEPRYPPLARQLRLSGTVVLHAIIGRDGNINGLQVVSGSPYFVQAALDAVRQWRYRPTLLDGEPVEVETTITVIFNLQS
jgi:protein TonB